MSGRVNFKEARAELKFVTRPFCLGKHHLQMTGSRFDKLNKGIFYFPLPFHMKNTQADIYLNYKNPRIPLVVFQY